MELYMWINRLTILLLTVVSGTKSASQIFGKYINHNFAQDKPAFQSSVLDIGIASKAVDGCYSQRYRSTCGCTRTKPEADPWWSVDLINQTAVHGVSLLNRGDCCGYRLADFDIWVMSDNHNPLLSHDKQSCKHYPGIVKTSGSKPESIECDQVLNGRYVAIELRNRGVANEVLTLCEVEVWSVESSLPCHCANGLECDPQTGQCPYDECASLLPDGYGWGGPACQVGNVAYGKKTTSNLDEVQAKKHNGSHLWTSSNHAIDGNVTTGIFSGSCTLVYKYLSWYDDSGSAWWMVDLIDMYVIYNVTLVNTDNALEAFYLETFDVMIGNVSNSLSHEWCARQEAQIPASENRTLVCKEPMIGRYVRVAKYTDDRGQKTKLPLCEVIVMGHWWIDVDWGWCADQEPNGIWCKQCVEGTAPTCRDAPCQSGYYGTECRHACGHCANSMPCNATTGHCIKCAPGWEPPYCDVQCDPGTFGIDCLNMCDCSRSCDPVNGSCIQSTNTSTTQTTPAQSTPKVERQSNSRVSNSSTRMQNIKQIIYNYTNNYQTRSVAVAFAVMCVCVVLLAYIVYASKRAQRSTLVRYAPEIGKENNAQSEDTFPIAHFTKNDDMCSLIDKNN